MKALQKCCTELFPVYSFVLAQIIYFIFHSTYNITIYFDLLLIVKGFPFQTNFVGGYQIEVYQSNKNTRKNIFYYLSNITPPPTLSRNNRGRESFNDST